MTILVAFDTVFEQCSVAILVQTDKDMAKILYHQTVAGARGQTEIILPMLQTALLHSNLTIQQIQAWVFNRGPGAFSGIRINTAVVQALSVANEAPCIGVSSLLALAKTAHQIHHFAEGTRLFTAIDARQNQIYLGQFIVQQGQVVAINMPNNPHGNESVVDYGSVVDCDVLVGCADLLQTYAQKISVQPTAIDLAHIGLSKFLHGKGVSAEYALPIYLRDNAWKTLAEQHKNKNQTQG